MSKIFYKKFQKLMKVLIKNFQAKNDLTKKFCAQMSSSCRSRKKRNKTWFVIFEKLIKHNERLYIFDNEIVRKKTINKNYDDSLIEHFNVEKILKLIQKKIFWLDYVKQTIMYIQICDVCQRIKILKYKL